MGKRKVFNKTDINVSKVGHGCDATDRIVIPHKTTPPVITTIAFGRNASGKRTFDFAPWYNTGIDPITYACQQQIMRFLAGQDSVVEISTVTAYCVNGLSYFLSYLVVYANAAGRGLSLSDVNRSIIDSFLCDLSFRGVVTTTQKGIYKNAKSVLLALGRRGLITIVDAGDAATFPRNPFPNSNRKYKGETPLTKRERQGVATALRQALMPIWSDDVSVTSDLLSYALLIVALHTGRNATPLLEMGRDCLRAHPKDNSVFLVLWKRRGYSTSKVALRAESIAERVLESTPTIKTNVERLIRRVLALTEPLRLECQEDLEGRVWLYRSRGGAVPAGQCLALSDRTLERGIKKLVVNYGLTDGDGQPLRLNVSRLRKTFANRIFELLDGDLAATAIALGNTPQVAGRNYLVPGEAAVKDWQFMGEILVQELLSRTLLATYERTPMGLCGDPVNGQYSPKAEGANCFSFLNCLRCKHYAVTADDLYKLFSFYFRVFTERSRMDKRRWAREYAHIPRLIDNYIVAEGLRRGAFNSKSVEAARERALRDPHPFWSVEIIESLEIFA